MAKEQTKILAKAQNLKDLEETLCHLEDNRIQHRYAIRLITKEYYSLVDLFKHQYGVTWHEYIREYHS